jgi:two-component system LytT family sensor kinase
MDLRSDDSGPNPRVSSNADDAPGLWPVHHRPVWARIAVAFAFWTAIGLFFATQRPLLLPGPNAWLDGLRMSMPRWYVWGLLAPLIARTDRILGVGRSRAARLLMHLPLGIAWTLVAIGVRFAIRPLLHDTYPQSVTGFVVERFQWDLLIYGVIAGVIVARDYATQARRSELDAARLSVRAAQLERSLTEARLHTLRSQLNPHFLFNALNAISAFTEREPKKARRLMAHLGDLLRASLDHSARPEVTLREACA